jgi:hypothetical protein
MFAQTFRSRARRRGVVLVVVLGMLGLLAVIGFTFATFSSQAVQNSRSFSLAQMFPPDANEMLDYALTQLINDTANPQSAIRGHSLKRDMYGTDAINNGPLLTQFPDGTGTLFSLQAVTKSPAVAPSPLVGTIRLQTNIPQNNYAFYPFSFLRWVIRFPSRVVQATGTVVVSRTYEIVADDNADASGFRCFYVAPPNQAIYQAAYGAGALNSPPSDPLIGDPANKGGYVSPDLVQAGFALPAGYTGWTSNLEVLPIGLPFALDGRYLRGFNGPGISGMNALGLDTALLANAFGGPYPVAHPLTEYANFRYNGNIFRNVVTNSFNAASTAGQFGPIYGDPNGGPTGQIFDWSGLNSVFMPGMDEDYDACDLENWFLAIQSADGQTMIPSFHRPGILVANPANLTDNDWTRTPSKATDAGQLLLATRAMSKILRPRAVDGHHPVSFPDLLPDATGKIQYDVDNDGDGINDSVWLDLGYPPKRDIEGKLFKPLFSFMVIGLNGRLPLNTAGNLQRRDATLTPMFDHADHLGFSPSEIDLKFAFQNGFDINFDLNPLTQKNSQVDNATVTNTDPTGTNPWPLPIPIALTQLRNVLAGGRPWDPQGILSGDNNVVLVNGSLVHLPNNVADNQDTGPPANPVGVATPPVPGRWGEEDSVPQLLPVPLPVAVAGPPVPPLPPEYQHLFYTNHVRAGLSRFSGANAIDARDDDHTSFDNWPQPHKPGTAAAPLTDPENFDRYDAAGALNMPVERLRRFVTPLDITGEGSIVTYSSRKRLGGDTYGRVSFSNYFRPPGLPIATWDPAGVGYMPVPPAAPNQNPTLPAPLTPTTAPLARLAPTWPDKTNNLYHGFSMALTPPAPTAGGALSIGAMPYDTVTTAGGATNPLPTPPGVAALTTVPPVYVPTFDNNIVSQMTVAAKIGSPGLNEADEMDLYNANRLDAPFGPADLEWLYRAQDVDGPTLESRLPQLAPISLSASIDASRRRRLFSLDSWEPTSFVWANDSAGGGFTGNNRFAPVQRVGVDPPSNASFFSLNANTPSIAHRDRRINLNFPLPVSNSPVEPIRQKWMRDTYTLLKTILPPAAVDTPEELAQLSQFVVNMIDFRDPDCTTTKFVNTDVVVIKATSPTAQPTLAFSSPDANALPTPRPDRSPAVAFDPTYLPSTSAAQPFTYLVQWGMEYPPVAINEVLAFQLNYKKAAVAAWPGPRPNTNANDVAKFCFELVNMLTQDAIPNSPASPDACDLDLTGWDAVVLPDNAYGRPDPFTGQIPEQPAAGGPPVNAYPLKAGGTANAGPGAPPTGLTAPTLLTAIGAAAGGTPTYFVVGNTLPAGAETVPLTPKITLDMTPELNTAGAGTGPNNYYWLYIRRPANPFDVNYDPTKPNDNRVVVDSFRFPYLQSQGMGYTDAAGDHVGTTNATTPPSTANDYIFSLARMQPYRGGHAIPPLAPPATGTWPTNYVLPAYGYSEQTDAPVTAASTYAGKYGTAQSTGFVYHSLGAVGTQKDDTWDYLQFNDRDFASVAELMMVPSCAPGLFTKQFGEMAPPITVTAPKAAPFNTLPATWTGTTWAQGTAFPNLFKANGAPHPFPYLNDEFFYSGAVEPRGTNTWPQGQNGGAALPTPLPFRSQSTVSTTNANGNYIGGPGSSGWFKMFDFFEVPSPAFKSIAPVAIGTNYDWARQDLRPGLLNLNLIIDEEVFLGLMGESIYGQMQQYTGLFSNGVLSQDQVSNSFGANPAILPPTVVTLVDDRGSPIVSPLVNGSYAMTNVGIYDNFHQPNSATLAFGNFMKACFSDFLKLTHGGSGYVFANGVGQTGEFGQFDVNLKVNHGIAASRPFHSLSYPDIDYTVLRPANLPPSRVITVGATTEATGFTTPPQTVPWAPAVGSFPPYPSPYPTPAAGPPAIANTGSTPAGLAIDPGLKNPYLFTRMDAVQPPPIPPRRLFQIPDYWGNQTGTPAYNLPPSNAASAVNFNGFGGDPAVNNLVVDNTPVVGVAPPPVNPRRISNFKMDLTADPNTSSTPTTVYLGGKGSTGPPVVVDQTDHPYFRTEWLQKVTNQTTVRTHQYAVWITVGFFEVLRQGDPMLAADPVNYPFAYDILGLELGKLEGENIRYRGFFLIDRTKAVGFNPALPGDFRECVAYRQIIE